MAIFPYHLRGAFGYALKDVCCRRKDQRACAMLHCDSVFDCPFPFIFKPMRAIFHGRPMLRKLRYVPRPFIFTPLLSRREFLSFCLRIFGTAIKYETDIIRALAGLKNRSFYKGKVRLKIREIAIVKDLMGFRATLYSSDGYFAKYPLETGILHDGEIEDWAKRNVCILGRGGGITLEFLTPVSFPRMDEGKGCIAPSDLVRYGARRRSLLNYFYKGRFFYDADEVMELMKWTDSRAEVIDQRLRPIPMAVKGRTGFYEGRISFRLAEDGEMAWKVLDLLKFGEYMGIGKMTAFGFGQYSLKFLGR
ncbi:MAG: CRISPR system precrRNA processing endoribonuclease RAMP protein Cas6 [Candidatus Bathyarchaeia archaeon]